MLSIISNNRYVGYNFGIQPTRISYVGLRISKDLNQNETDLRLEIDPLALQVEIPL